MGFVKLNDTLSVWIMRYKSKEFGDGSDRLRNLIKGLSLPLYDELRYTVRVRQDEKMRTAA